jgi:hypothetical protein
MVRSAGPQLGPATVANYVAALHAARDALRTTRDRLASDRTHGAFDLLAGAGQPLPAEAVAWSSTAGKPFAACDRNPSAEPFTTRITSLLALVPTAVMIQRKLASAAGLGVIRICSSVSSVGEREQYWNLKNSRLCRSYARPHFILSLREDQGGGTTRTLRSFVKTYPEDWCTRDDFNGGTSYNDNFYRHPENDAERDAFLADSPARGSTSREQTPLTPWPTPPCGRPGPTCTPSCSPSFAAVASETPPAGTPSKP